MNWNLIRTHFDKLFQEGKRTGALTQVSLAKKGGLKTQGMVSRILHTTNDHGPSVGTFLKAIKGLDMRPSDFFADLERIDTEYDRLPKRLLLDDFADAGVHAPQPAPRGKRPRRVTYENRASAVPASVEDQLDNVIRYHMAHILAAVKTAHLGWPAADPVAGRKPTHRPRADDQSLRRGADRRRHRKTA